MSMQHCCSFLMVRLHSLYLYCLQVNTLSAGVVAGAAICAGTRNWKPVALNIGLFCTFVEFVKDYKS